MGRSCERRPSQGGCFGIVGGCSSLDVGAEGLLRVSTDYTTTRAAIWTDRTGTAAIDHVFSDCGGLCGAGCRVWV